MPKAVVVGRERRDGAPRTAQPAARRKTVSGKPLTIGARAWLAATLGLQAIGFCGAARAQEDRPSLSAAIETEPHAVFVCERFQLTLTVTAEGVPLGQDFKLRGLPDESRLKTGSFRELAPVREQRAGRLFEVRRFTARARAMQPGALSLAPTLQAAVVTRRWSLLGPITQETLVNVAIPPLILPVEPLPAAGRPADFSGAVGQFTVAAEARPAELALGDLVTVVTRVRGRGYLENVRPPQVPAAPDFKVYPPQAVSPPEADERVFEQVVVPQSTNAASVPAVTFSFFDPLAKSYTTLSQGPFRLAFRPRETTAFEPYRPPAPARGPAPARPASVLRKAVASRRQAAAALAYWAVAAGALLALAARGKRRVLAALAVLAVASAAYLPFRAIVERAVFRTAEAVAERGATARLAPAGTALETFDLPAGSRVRVLEVFGHWAKIEFGDKRGWIPRESLHGLDELAVLPAAD